MRWDIKLVSYSLLIYFIYGVINLLDLNDFIVPLPLSFILAIIIPIVFIIKTKLSYYSILYIGIPLLMQKDLFIYYNELVGITLVILGILTWMILGIELIRKANKNTFIKVAGVLLIFAPILLINSLVLSTIYLIILLLINFQVIQKSLLKFILPLERALLLLCFIVALYLMNEVSIILVNI